MRAARAFAGAIMRVIKNHKDDGREMFRTKPLKPINYDINIPLHPQKQSVLEFLNLTRLASSHTLLAMMKGGNLTNARIKLRWLFDRELISKPAQFESSWKSFLQAHIYELTEKGKRYLKLDNRWSDTIGPQPPYANFAHEFYTAHVIGSRELWCRDNGYRMIPAHELFRDRKNLRIPQNIIVDKQHYKSITPDYASAIDYGEYTILYLDEIDRDTEDNEKRIFAKLARYDAIMKQRLMSQYFGLPDRFVVNFFTVSEGHAAFVRELAYKHFGKIDWLNTGVVDEFATPWYPPKPSYHLFDQT